MTDKKTIEKKTKMKRRLNGTVVSTKMQGTALVKVERTKVHPRYGKRYTQSKKYPSHIGKIEISEGDRVVIEEIRPLSKTKRYKIVEKVK
jgi:small subunit ribosomal protein S17